VTLPSSADSPAGRALGMLVPSLDYYWPHVARGAEEAARELDLRVVLRGSSYETVNDKPQLARLLDQPGVDALVVAPRMDAPTAQATIEWLAGTGIPVVLLERTATAGPHHAVLESVVTDHALGAAMAVRHLATLGHRKVGLVLAENSPTGPHVHRGWVSAVEECGLSTDTVDVRVPDAHQPECPAALDRVLDQVLSGGTTALLVHADAEAIALVQRCEERRLTVPGDLSVIAYDDEVAGMFSPPLTAVRPPRRSIGRAAVRLVADRLTDPGRPAHRVVISPALRVRGSSAAPGRAG
jgi:DNA-binding LacI/PurR family transcriptional regulator